jgi:hypothetical protein
MNTYSSKSYGRLNGMAPECECAIAIERRAGRHLARDRVDHHDTRTRVEGAHARQVALRRHDRHVADATQVLQRTPVGGTREEHRIGDGNERRPLPSGRDIAHAEVGDDVDAGALGDHGGLAGLPRRMTGDVPDRLSVRRDRGNLTARDPGLGDGRRGGICKPVTQVEAEPAVLVRRRAPERPAQPAALFIRVWDLAEGEQLETSRGRKAHDCRRDAVQ